MLKYPRLFINHLKALAMPPPSSKADCLSQQTRNTFILKRKYPVRLHKKNYRPYKLKTRNYIYELVEDTNNRKKEPLDLILTQYVKGLGNMGTKVSLHPNEAYKTLLLPRLADYATPENIEKYTKLADQADDVPFSSASVENTMKYLAQMEIPVLMSKNIPWTLEKWHVRSNLRMAGVYMDTEDAITMPEETISGPNLDIEGKEFYITLTINNCEQVKVKCCLNHVEPRNIA